MQGATSAPLIEQTIQQATGIVFNVTGGTDLTLSEVNKVSQVIATMAGPDCNIMCASASIALLQSASTFAVIAVLTGARFPGLE